MPYAVNRPKVEKLIEFLENLPEDKFDFGEVVRKGECGTVGCAIGWCPSVFPEEVVWIDSGEFMTGGLDIALEEEESSYTSFDRVSEVLFGISELVSNNLFVPNEQRDVHPELQNCGFEASPKEVGAMLFQFLELVEAGEIRGHVIA